MASLSGGDDDDDDFRVWVKFIGCFFRCCFAVETKEEKKIRGKRWPMATDDDGGRESSFSLVRAAHNFKCNGIQFVLHYIFTMRACADSFPIRCVLLPPSPPPPPCGAHRYMSEQ